MENKEFVLPEKWCIARNKDTHKEINRWFNDRYRIKQKFSGYGSVNGIYIHSPKSGYYWFNTFPYPGYTLITYEQFLQYVVGNSQTYSIY